ncbi:hypothetical protein HRbin01_00528 [archaeon HR01]|nr:hypothetical protein HRbin01_00528 [archaeon HR01]
MAGISKLLQNPPMFYKSLESDDRIRRGILVLALATSSSIILSLIYYQVKTVYEIFLPSPISLDLNVLHTDFLIMSNLTAIFITSVVLIGVGRLAAKIVRGKDVSLKAFVSAIFHSFFLLFILNVVSAPLILAAPSEKVYVIGAELENVVFFNITLTGYTPSGEMVNITRDVLTVSRLDVERAATDGTRISSSLVDRKRFEEIIQGSASNITMTGVSGAETELDHVRVVTLAFDDYVARRTVLSDILVVSEGVDLPYLATLPGINTVRNIVWRVMLVLGLYWSLRALHLISRKVSIPVAILSYLILANFVPAPF